MSKPWNDGLQNINSGYLQIVGVGGIFVVPSTFFSVFIFSIINMSLNAEKTQKTKQAIEELRGKYK